MVIISPANDTLPESFTFSRDNFKKHVAATLTCNTIFIPDVGVAESEFN